MGKGKSKTTSKSAYTDTINMCINNTKFSAPEENPNVNHKEKFYTKYFINSNNQFTATRNPLSINDAQARKKFLRLVSEFESNTELKLSDTSKSELLLLFLDFAETTNSLIHLKDDARQFLVYRFLFPDLIDKMISENSIRLQQKTDNSLNLSSVYNNPNCIISNLFLKDYEMIDFIITHSAKSFEEYYFKTDDADLKTSKVCEIIDCIDEIGYTETMAKIISPFANLQTNNVDYYKVIDWIKPIK